MWMNLGYWKEQLDNPEDFPAACRALLERVFEAAQLHTEGGSPEICLLDAGFGCGDQTVSLLPNATSSVGDMMDGRGKPLPFVARYVGITKDTRQFSYAWKRLGSLGLLPGPSHMGTAKSETRAMIFCNDAANPTKWSEDLKKEVQNLRSFARETDGSPLWLLGLDSMYHFTPSRLPLLLYARRELEASFMAFDLVMADGVKAPGTIQRLLLRFICLLTSTPYSNLLVEKDYRQLLETAGYDQSNIKIEDVSSYVFEPLSCFFKTQDTYLRSIGLSLGRFHGARLIFAWWARTGIVRGCVVVATHANS